MPPPVATTADADTALDRLVTGCAVVPHELVLVLLAAPGIGGLRPARLTHRDARRAEVLHARLRAELRLPGPPEGEAEAEVAPEGQGDGRAVDVAGLPEPVRAVLAEEAGGPVVVVPVAGRWSAPGPGRGRW